MNITLFHLLNNLLFINVGFDTFVYYVTTTFPYSIAIVTFVFLLFYPTYKDNGKRPELISTPISFKILSLRSVLAELKTNYAFGIPNRIAKVIHVFLSAGATYLIVIILKNIIAYPRPYEVLNNMKTLLTDGTGNSFPSNHAAFFAVIATVVWFHHKKAGILFAVAAFAIGLSRIVAGVHYPIDVLVGWGIGVGIGILANNIWKRVSRMTNDQIPITKQ